MRSDGRKLVKIYSPSRWAGTFPVFKGRSLGRFRLRLHAVRSALPLLPLLVLALVSGCRSNTKGSVDASPVTSIGEPVFECSGLDCAAKFLTDDTAAQLRARPDSRATTLTFRAGATNADFRTVAKIPWLQKLRIDSDAIDDVLPLLELTDLTDLAIGAARVRSIAVLANTQRLVRFDARGVEEIEDLAPLGAHTALTVVLASATRIADVRFALSTPALVRLEIARTRVTTLVPLQALAHLEELDASDTAVTDLAPLTRRRPLRRLALARTQVRDLTPLASQTDLESLDLAATQVRSLGPLSSMNKLLRLSVAGAKHLESLHGLAGAKALQILDLSDTPVDDLSVLAHCARLRVLFLDGTRIRTVLPLQRLTELEELRLARTTVRDLGALGNLTRLRRVTVPADFPVSARSALVRDHPDADIQQDPR